MIVNGLFVIKIIMIHMASERTLVNINGSLCCCWLVNEEEEGQDGRDAQSAS